MTNLPRTALVIRAKSEAVPISMEFHLFPGVHRAHALCAAISQASGVEWCAIHGSDVPLIDKTIFVNGKATADRFNDYIVAKGPAPVAGEAA